METSWCRGAKLSPVATLRNILQVVFDALIQSGSKAIMSNILALPSFLILTRCNPVGDVSVLVRQRGDGAFLVLVPVPEGIAIRFVLTDLPQTNDNPTTLTQRQSSPRFPTNTTHVIFAALRQSRDPTDFKWRGFAHLHTPFAIHRQIHENGTVLPRPI